MGWRLDGAVLTAIKSVENISKLKNIDMRYWSSNTSWLSLVNSLNFSQYLRFPSVYHIEGMLSGEEKKKKRGEKEECDVKVFIGFS